MSKVFRCILAMTTLLVVLPVHAKFIGGIGYIRPEDYRVDNNVSPLPFGLGVVPLIIYRGERLQVFGPNAIYLLLRGIVSFGLRVNATGDRYESRDLKLRDTAINAGVSLRILFLNINHGYDISGMYEGHTTNVNIGWRFRLSKRLMIAPNIGKEFLSEEYVNYYYGVSEEQVGAYPLYQVGSAVNDVYRMNVSYSLDKKNSLSINYSYTKFDEDIFNSPTISQESFDTWAFFWNYHF